MPNITFSAEEDLLEAAQIRALAEGSTLEDEVRRWLESYAQYQWPAQETENTST
jgi:hypothetical protein